MIAVVQWNAQPGDYACYTHTCTCIYISYMYIPVSVCVDVIHVVVDEARYGGTGDSQTQRRHHVTSLKQVRMITHLECQTEHIQYTCTLYIVHVHVVDVQVHTMYMYGGS